MTIEKLNEISEKVQRYLVENRIWADVYPMGNGLPVICVHISWGDWKHEHLRTKWLLEEIGALHFGYEVTEENGTDTYSAVHRFGVNDGMFKEE